MQLAPAAAQAVSVCPVQSTDTHPIHLHGGSCYQFHLRETRGFSAAQAECRSQGGNEVIIRDADTQRFLFDVIQRVFQYKGVVWIGLNDVTQEGHFTWVDGSPLTFTFWANGQPGGLLGPLEDCVVMDMGDGGRWHDYRCEDFLFLRDPHPFICQFGAVFKRLSRLRVRVYPREGKLPEGKQ
ncbi:galactose-specific lectin nattectin-like [Babylonia areolata]|uniref:galactose-specific lectin nattectin-like n=1 Tax=Babylonia areolata TaxID=304850 RepID=UPI003FD170E8